jgi:hypothetical protein
MILKLENKYTVEFEETTGKMTCKRYGESDWRDIQGDGLILALMQRIEKLKEICNNLSTYREGTNNYKDAISEFENIKKEDLTI